MGRAPRARAVARRRARPADAARPGAARSRRVDRAARRRDPRRTSSAGTTRPPGDRGRGATSRRRGASTACRGRRPPDPRPRPGHDVVAGDRVRARRPAGRERPADRSSSGSRRRATSPTTPRRSGRASSRSRARSSARSAAPSGSPRSGSRTSARRRSSGTARPASRSPTRSSGSRRITAPACERLRAAGHEALFRARTGLPLDAYFCGPEDRRTSSTRCPARAPVPSAASSRSGPWTRSCSGA